MSDTEDLNDTFSKENNMAYAMRNIFDSCDEQQTGRVAVSKLVDYIKPYMGANVSEINALQACLDPNDTDPEITSDVFFNVMSDWAKKFDQEESFHNISPTHLDNPPLVESTPRKSFGGRQARIHAEAVALDMSIVEATSFLGTDCNESIMEKSILEDQIKQLTHQSRKFNDELLLARSQLIGQEEQNLGLQNEIEKLKKDLKHEREINETLLKDHKNFEELRESSFNKQKSIEQLKKELQSIEKEKNQLQEHNMSLDHEKQRIEEKMLHIHEKLAQSRKEAIELRAEMNMKDEQLTYANVAKKDLLLKITDLKDTIANLEEANTCLRVEKEKISKLLQDNIKLQSQAVIAYAPQMQSEYTPDAPNTHAAPPAPPTTLDTNHTTQPHADISKYFSQQSTQEAHSTSQLSADEDDHTLTTHETRTHLQTNDANANEPQLQATQNGRLREVSKRFNSDGSPIPFTSPIKTSKFTFFNIDSPIAKRCAKFNADAPPLADSSGNVSLPLTPTDLVSPPGMYVIERTAERKSSLLEPVNLSIDESSNDDELLQTAYSSIATSSQASLMDEFAALRQPLQSISEHTCPSCNMGVEVKKRLDDLYDQKEHFVYLLQNTERLQLDNQLQDKTISDLNKTLEISRRTEEDLIRKYSEAKEQLERLEHVEQNLSDYMKEYAVARNHLQKAESEKEKLTKDNAVSQDMILRLKDEVKALENTKKRLELTIQNLQAEKENIVEQHKMKLDECAEQLRQARDDINELEVKFYASHDQVTSLLTQNKDLAATNTKLRQQHQKLVESYQEIQKELQDYVKIIDNTSSKDLSTKEKLNLLKSAEEFSQLQERCTNLIKDKQKECEEFSSRIQELEKQCKQCKAVPTKETQTSKKATHDRTQIQLERFREKIDYLEDVLKQEKVKQAALKQEVQQLQMCNESLLNEKTDCCALQKRYRELVCETRDLLNGCLRARHNMLKFFNNWKVLFEKVESVDTLFCHLCENDEVMDNLCSQMKNISTDSDIAQAHISPKEMALSKNYLQTISLIMETLGSFNVNIIFDDLSARPSTEDAKTLHSLPLKTREMLISRPMSPDSPNLGALDEITSLTIGAGDVHLLRYTNTEFVDSEGCDCDGDGGEDADRSSSEDEFDGSAPDPFEVLRTMYLPENVEFLINSIRVEQLSEGPSALAGFVDDFGLTFMVDCTGYRNRLRGQFERLREAVTRLVDQFQALLLLARTPKLQMRAAAGIVNSLFELTKSAERYGAIQQEVEASRTISRLIAYITHLRDGGTKAEMMLRSRGSGETALFDGSGTQQRAVAAGMQCDATTHDAHQQRRIMSLLHTMRPANVVRLVGAAALAFLIYYFSQRFVFLTADADSAGGFGGGLQRNAVCWPAWVDFLAACFGRLHENGPPPI